MSGTEFISIDALIIDQFEPLRHCFTEFRKAIAARPLLPYIFLEITPKPTAAVAIAIGDRIMEEGWSLPGATISIQPPVQWEGHPRSFEFHLHAWQPIQRLLVAFDLSKSWKYFQAAFDMAEDWMRACPIKPTGMPIAQGVARILKSEEGSWWYDMAVAQRLQQLSYIVDVGSRTHNIADECFVNMMDQVLLHQCALASERLFRPGSNHGLFQALNQYAAISRLPELDVDGYLLNLSMQRLRRMVEKQYSKNMLHMEHSSGYHHMVTVSLMNAKNAGVLALDLSLCLKNAEENLGWMIMPSGNLVSFGDTDPRCLSQYNEEPFFDEPTLLATLNKDTLTPTGIRAYRDEGYVFSRLYAGDVDQDPKNATYLAQIAAFHSRVHKHADHLSFVWYDRNRDILIDPGRYGYAGRTEQGSDLFKQGFWYSDPKRIYCESTRAHNTVEIDGQSFPRAKVKPFGSALVYAGEEDGCAVTYCEATHFRSIRHNRHLIMEPGRFLLVLDWLYDRTGVEHDYRQFFHFADKWQVISKDGSVSAHHQGGPVSPLDIRARSLIAGAVVSPVVRGQEKPELLGWLSDKANSLIPTSCFHVHKRTIEPALFATLFVFGTTLEIDHKLTRFNNSMTVGQAVWTDDYGSRCIKIQRPKSEEGVRRSTPGHSKGIISIV